MLARIIFVSEGVDTCSSITSGWCGGAAENRTTQAKFAFIECGYEHHADVVGAINVLERGQRLLACGETVLLGRSMKQEPSEATRMRGSTPAASAVGIPVHALTRKPSEKIGRKSRINVLCNSQRATGAVSKDRCITASVDRPAVATPLDIQTDRIRAG